MNDLINRTIDYLEKRQRSVYRQDVEEVPEELDRESDTIFVGSIFFMEKFTYIIEKLLVDQKHRDGNLFVNFLTFGNFKQRLDRYAKIESLGNRLWVYGADEHAGL